MARPEAVSGMVAFLAAGKTSCMTGQIEQVKGDNVL
jgi:hypothetical protein